MARSQLGRSGSISTACTRAPRSAFRFSDGKTEADREGDLPKAMKQAEGGYEAQWVWVQSPYLLFCDLASLNEDARL